MQLPGSFFKPKLERKNKKNRSKKIIIFSYISRNRISCYNIEKFLIFSQKKAFLILLELETPQKVFIFQKIETLKCFLYFRKWLSWFSKEEEPTLKKFLIFWEIELASHRLKKLPVFQEELSKSQKPKLLMFL